ncbi:unnamed protein product [marine sediment metagenome]|uniref:Uncharacterized protein n=1 Tax=marine sediment metagenome TaxID=412755 RepID=X0VAY9_9ZZZZ
MEAMNKTLKIFLWLMVIVLTNVATAVIVNQINSEKTLTRDVLTDHRADFITEAEVITCIESEGMVKKRMSVEEFGIKMPAMLGKMLIGGLAILVMIVIASIVGLLMKFFSDLDSSYC